MKTSDFERWYVQFRKNASDRDDLYLADLLFHGFYQSESALQRLRFGFPGWMAWLIFQSFKLRRRPGELQPVVNAEFLFLPVSTEAHEETLLPIARELAASNSLILNPPSKRWNELELPVASAIAHGVQPRLSDLARALRCARAAATAARHTSGSGIDRRRVLVLLDSVVQATLWERSSQVPTAEGMVFLTYELSPITKSACLKARAAGRRVIHIMHGQRLPTYQVTSATDLVLFSKVDESWFRERVDEHVRIWTVGHPRLEAVRNQIGGGGEASANRRPRIAFFSQPSEGDYGRETRKRDWALLAGLHGRADVRFRLHPRESRTDAIDDLAEMGIDFVTLSDAGLVEDLKWCDAVASSWSTVSMEAAACGRGVFWTCSTPERYEASAELRAHGIGVLIREPADWKGPLEAWSSGAWEAPITVPESRLRELGMIGDMDTPWLERWALVDSKPNPNVIGDPPR